MTTAGEVMHAPAVCIDDQDTLAAAAQRMRDLGVGALPICGADDRLHGMLTDRDIIVKCVAAGKDPTQVTAGELAQEILHHVDSSATVEQMLQVMEQHQVRRLPVIDDHQRLVGIVSEADIARHLSDQSIAEFVRAICERQEIPSA